VNAGLIPSRSPGGGRGPPTSSWTRRPGRGGPASTPWRMWTWTAGAPSMGRPPSPSGGFICRWCFAGA